MPVIIQPNDVILAIDLSITIKVAITWTTTVGFQVMIQPDNVVDTVDMAISIRITTPAPGIVEYVDG